MIHQPRIIAVGGGSSNVGKTTLMCQLLRAFPGWEAIKTTRGHYRSCGKDPQTCCVSHLLSDEPMIRSGRDQTYAPGKDTGRYWDAGARNVHWVIATEEQLAQGIREALKRVRSQGVFIEGNSFTEFVQVDALIIAVRESNPKIKPSARRALRQATALYIWRDSEQMAGPGKSALNQWGEVLGFDRGLARVPLYAPESFSDLIMSLRESASSVRS